MKRFIIILRICFFFTKIKGKVDPFKELFPLSKSLFHKKVLTVYLMSGFVCVTFQTKIFMSVLGTS